MSDVSRETFVDRDDVRSEIASVIPEGDELTPLAAQAAADARRRIQLQGQRFKRPAHTRILTVANQKGGVGKTTTTVNIAAAMALSGLRVLVIDSDPQGNASTALGVEHRAGTPSVYSVLMGEASVAQVIQGVRGFENLFCVAATIDLSGAEIELVNLERRERRLGDALEAFLSSQTGERRIDYVLIDCPPSLGLLTINAFVAAREALIPIQCEYYALEGLSQLLDNIALIKKHLNPDLDVSTILMTMFDLRTNLSQDVVRDVREHFGSVVLQATIPRNVRISEAPGYGQTVMTYDPGSTGALAYLQAAKEMSEMGVHNG